MVLLYFLGGSQTSHTLQLLLNPRRLHFPAPLRISLPPPPSSSLKTPCIHWLANAIWEAIQDDLNVQYKETGHLTCVSQRCVKMNIKDIPLWLFPHHVRHSYVM